MMMATSAKVAKMLASMPVVNGTSRNQEVREVATRSIAPLATLSTFATGTSCLLRVYMATVTMARFLRALALRNVLCGEVDTRDKPENATGQAAQTMQVNSMHALTYKSTVTEKTVIPPAH